MEIALVLIVGTFVIFVNGCMTGMVVAASTSENKSFAKAWNEEVNDSQDTWLGRILMRTFYLIPQLIAFVSKKRVAFEDTSL